ncbi:Oidioi.mRNA.OKI2018_I69.XSR.g15153.t1.cds [Oikopleura dioica]|uniref:Oidioi.mRNA.OKI2018_I69.XSR.g15153.t1.cds n=1 Tax=Oikopleura dioica TaxID=34765 RepID=A0ABN7SBZ2_OIKDI|nr:Oidioi.mRNA.OKI2018_I69.XSR.g15153.t1.cds [Oikopleura dioica]
MLLFLFSVPLVSAGLEVRGRTPDVFYDYEVDCSDEYWQFNDPECQQEITNEENTRVGDRIYPIMGDWSTWTACDKSCEEGSQTRVRFCAKEDICHEESQKEVRACNTKIRRNRSPWNEWSSCSSDCTRFRLKVCKDDNFCGCRDLRRTEDCSNGMCRRCMANPENWEDSSGDTCVAYGKEGWCNEHGEKGPNWPTTGHLAKATFDTYSNEGFNARQCPECGCTEV